MSWRRRTYQLRLLPLAHAHHFAVDGGDLLRQRAARAHAGQDAAELALARKAIVESFGLGAEAESSIRTRERGRERERERDRPVL